jgi:hypothetical protein
MDWRGRERRIDERESLLEQAAGEGIYRTVEAS